MVNKAILLTGLSGTGKTTLSAYLKEMIFPVEHLKLGTYIFSLVKERIPELTYDEFRSNTVRYVKETDMEEVYRKVASDIKNFRENHNIILDGHAINYEENGIRVRTASEDFLRKVELNAIIILRLSPNHVQSRIRTDSSGRKNPHISDFQVLETLQYSLGILYSSISNCPLYVINADTSLQEISSRVLRIFDSIGMEYTLTAGKLPNE